MDCSIITMPRFLSFNIYPVALSYMDVCFHILAGAQHFLQFTCAPSKDSNQAAHQRSLIRVYAGSLRMFWGLYSYIHIAPSKDSNLYTVEKCCAPAHLLFIRYFYLLRKV